jgi:hypothetical protein
MALSTNRKIKNIINENKKKIKMTSSQNNKINNYIKELNIHFKIELFIKDLDNGDLEILKTSINNSNKDNSEKIDIPLEIYKKWLS